MNAGVFITCNHIPDFGVEQDNVERRLAIFHLTELPNQFEGAPQWLFDHSMEILHWIVNTLNANQHLIEPDERFYELPYNERSKLSLEPDRISKIELETIKNCSIKEPEPELVTKKLCIDDQMSSEFKDNGEHLLLVLLAP